MICQTRVEKVLFEGKRAVGVRARVTDPKGRSHTIVVKAKVVVVSAGTFFSR